MISTLSDPLLHHHKYVQLRHHKVCIISFTTQMRYSSSKSKTISIKLLSNFSFILKRSIRIFHSKTWKFWYQFRATRWKMKLRLKMGLYKISLWSCRSKIRFNKSRPTLRQSLNIIFSSTIFKTWTFLIFPNILFFKNGLGFLELFEVFGCIQK